MHWFHLAFLFHMLSQEIECRSPIYISFADDLVVFTRGSRATVKVLFGFLEDYEATLG